MRVAFLCHTMQEVTGGSPWASQPAASYCCREYAEAPVVRCFLLWKKGQGLTEDVRQQKTGCSFRSLVSRRYKCTPQYC